MTNTERTETLAANECIEWDIEESPCRGAVEYRYPLSPSGTPFPRCDQHWQDRLDREQGMIERLGHWNSDVAPSWFDPTACGEVWSEQDY